MEKSPRRGPHLLPRGRGQPVPPLPSCRRLLAAVVDAPRDAQPMAIVDTPKLARELPDKDGFPQEAAEATAEALNNALGDEIATKRDVTDLSIGLRGEMAQLRTELRSEITQLSADLRKGWPIRERNLSNGCLVRPS